MFKLDPKIFSPHDLQAIDLYSNLADYYAVKYDILKTKFPDAKTIGEIGVRAGGAAWTFLQACPEAEYHGFDMDDKQYGTLSNGEKFTDWAKDLLKDYNFTLHKANTQLIKSLPVDKKFDFIHVDGDHSKAGVMHDLELSIKSLSDDPRAFLLIDDYTHPQLPEVKAGVDEWLENNKLSTDCEFRKSWRGEMMIWRKVL